MRSKASTENGMSLSQRSEVTVYKIRKCLLLFNLLGYILLLLESEATKKNHVMIIFTCILSYALCLCLSVCTLHECMSALRGPEKRRGGSDCVFHSPK